MLKEFIKKHFIKRVVKPINIPVISNSCLKGKTALVFGGSGGIGEAITSSFIANGCKVVITGTNEEKLKKICSKYSDGSIFYKVLDLSNIKDIKEVISDSAAILGNISIFVYAAGVHCKDKFGSIAESTWDNVIDINLKGMYFVCQESGNYMLKNNIKGHILTIGSASGNKPGWTPYEISKHGVKALTLGFADKYIHEGIVVNCIAPGPVATSMLNASANDLNWDGNPSGRMCSPQEIANLALFMVSDTGSMIVGDSVYISGGSGTICLDK